MAVLQDNLKNNRENKKYATMINGKIRIAQEDYEAHMQKLQKARQSADILFELLAYGILVIENSAE
jgi:hypothetical protein